VDIVRKIIAIIIILIFISVSSTVAGDKSDEDTIYLRPGYLKYTEDKILVSKGVKIIKGENIINAQEGEYYTEENKAILKGEVRLEHSNGSVSSSELLAWLASDEYIFNRDVKLSHNYNDHEFTLEAPHLEMTANDSFEASEGVVIYYKKRLIKADNVKYNNEDETLDLNGNVHIQEENGDWIRSIKAIFYLNEENEGFVADGEVEVEIKIKND
jgi:lipopolysaccharide assembly outer membrane protein LptD (OstA)